MTSLATTTSNKKKPEANLAVNPGLCCLEFDVDVVTDELFPLEVSYPLSACGCLVGRRDFSATGALALAIVTVLLVGVVNELPTGRGVVFVSHGRLRAVTDSNLLSCLHLHSK